jgi:hypothetical protein
MPVAANTPPPATTTINAPAPVNAAAVAQKNPCGFTAPKLGAVIDHNELLSGDTLQYSDGVQVICVRKQGADEFCGTTSWLIIRYHPNTYHVVENKQLHELIEKQFNRFIQDNQQIRALSDANSRYHSSICKSGDEAQNSVQ